MKKLWLIIGLILSLSFRGNGQGFQEILEGEIQDNMPGISFSILSEDGKISWSGAAGLTDKETKKPLSSEHTFRIASVTKTFVAASILRLMEMDSLQLEDLLASHISEEHTRILSEDYPMNQITIRQVLRHAAGFFDHTNAPEFFDTVLKDPKHEWTRTEQIQLGVEKGEPIGPPGEQFSYSDTGYILLGEIIEKYTQKDLDEGIKVLLGLEKLQLFRTDFERKDPTTDSLRIHQYLQGMDTYGFSPTMDYYGGGGFLSTTPELIAFFKALFNNQIFDNPKTLEIMLEPVEYEKPARMDYQMGMYRVKINGMMAYTHTGFWGTQVLYIPEKDLYMAANYSQVWRGGAVAPVFSKILDAL
ncbi:class A beta-lactamase-related serine hydrolase [Algoriphagus kandeliae]|uniref:Class A beta-lactamase-related serine hydrolase n=1 Tax=Algoriphagus kandeliae TaxID=2562278 RepID=A0A4Y9QPI0_9BACT|nr:serine hydrolase domain-containing protein [Algoriphagus kandeliae]TFV94544.1 class A beta-lactamase-related serine hydrolase [Algoriphagus kandeliae]